MKKDTIQNHGFQPDEITDDQYVFGSSKMLQELLQESGQWDDFLPEKEYQRQHGLETYNCTNFGTENALKIIHKRKYEAEEDKAERYMGVITKISRGSGGSAHTASEAIRKHGMIPEELLPFSKDINTWDEYYSPNPMTKKYLNVGEEWKNKYMFQHEWTFPSWLNWEQKKKNMIDALKYSPLGISVLAWKRNSKGLYYKNSNERDNHWCVCYGYKLNEYWKILDTYDGTLKKLTWNYYFGFSKKFFLGKKPPVYETQADGYIDGKPVPRGSWINGTDMFRWIKKIDWNGWPFKQIGGWFKN